MPPRIQPAPQLTGKQLPQVRQTLRLSQKNLARALGVKLGYIGWLELNNRPLQPYLCERIYGMRGLRTFLRDEISRLERKNDWHSSVRFGQRPPFQTLPDPGKACRCGQGKCSLKPIKDGDWPGRGHLWLFQGLLCYRYVYLDGKGKKQPPPNRWDDHRSMVPKETCSKCGRQKGLSTGFIEKLGRKFYYRYCLRKKGDPSNLEHDPRTTYWEKGGRVEKVPPEILRSVRERHSFTFPVPICEKPECPQLGNRMEISGTAFQAIKRFKCLGLPVHYEFRALPNGEVAEHLGYGYRWTDARTGEVKEVKRKDQKPIRYPLPPQKMCPKHGVELRRASGPWKRRATKKLVWGVVCPTGGERYYVSHGEKVRLSRASRWAKGGRPTGITKEVQKQIEKAAAFDLCNWSKRKMAPHLFPDKPASYYTNTKQLFRRYPAEIKAAKKHLTIKEAQKTVRSAVGRGTKTSE